MSGFVTQNPHKGCALITGAGGRLGALLRAARDLSPQVGRSFLFQSRGPGMDICWSPGDSTEDLPRVDAVIALWGATSGTEDELAENARLVPVTSQLARDLGASKVIHLSSAAIYGPGQDMNEDHPIGNCNPYGKSKIDMEHAVDAHREADGLVHICLRLANVVGADSLAPALRQSSPATIDNFGTDTHPQGPLRSYISATDLLAIFDALINLPAAAWPHVLNIACPTPIAMDALILAADKEVIWRSAPQSAVAQVTLDVTRLQTLLPSLSFLSTAPALINAWRRLESAR